MVLIPDDPIIRAIEATGYPQWMQGDEDYEDDIFASYESDLKGDWDEEV